MWKTPFEFHSQIRRRSSPRTWSSKELASSLVVFLFGIVVIAGSLQYRLGTLSQIGPGLFPLILGALLVLLSMVLLIGAASSKERVPFPYVRESIFISAGIIVFAVMISRFGLLPAVVLSTAVLAFAQRRRSVLEIAGISLGLSIITYFLFVYLLSMNIPYLRW